MAGRQPLSHLMVVALGLLLAACSSSGAPEIQSIGFGTGGSGCDLTDKASTFPAGVTVLLVATFSPLPSSVTITLTRDAALIDGPTTIKVDASLGCVNGRLPNLEAGHYKIVVTVPASEMPPLTGEFDVTP